MNTRRIYCPCGSGYTIHQAGIVRDSDFEAENWRKVLGVWKCWECLGLPMSAGIRGAMERLDDQEPPTPPPQEDGP